MIIYVNFDKYKVVEGKQHCYNYPFDHYRCDSPQFSAFPCVTHRLKKL